MDLPDFLKLIGEKINAAGLKGDYEEALRLLGVARDALDDVRRKIIEERDKK